MILSGLSENFDRIMVTDNGTDNPDNGYRLLSGYHSLVPPCIWITSKTKGLSCANFILYDYRFAYKMDKMQKLASLANNVVKLNRGSYY